jgi:hypothetical protein
VKMEAICSSETSVYTTSIRCHIPEDGILQIYYTYIKKFLCCIVYIYFRLKCNLLSCPTSLSVHVSAVYGHHQVNIYYLWLYSPCEPWPLLQFFNLYTVGRYPWTGDEPVARPLHTHRITQTQNKCTQISMHRVGFEPTIPAFERAKTFHALECSATVFGRCSPTLPEFFHCMLKLHTEYERDVQAKSYPCNGPHMPIGL